MSESVLVVEDEVDVADLVRYNLDRAGFQVYVAHDGETGFSLLKRHHPDCLVLDLMLPGLGGIDFCKRVRKSNGFSLLPVIMLTARGEPEDRVRGLQSGADDYVTKPFSPKELVLRVNAVLRRSRPRPMNDTFSVKGLVVNTRTLEAHLSGKRIDLTAIEFKLLRRLVEQRGRVQKRETLLKDVWGYSREVDTRTVDTHIRRLREKLGDVSHLLETIRGEGYVLRGGE